MPSRSNRDLGSFHPSARTELQFRGFPEFRSNVLYCPKQFFTVVVPNSTVNTIRVVAHMLRKTLGWVDEDGNPIQEKHEFSHRDLEQVAGVSHSRLSEALADALKFNFIRRAQKARVQIEGVRARSAAFELLWDEAWYTDDLKLFNGFYLQPSYTDESGQNRIGRKNIPNIFFDYLIREENRALIRVVGTLLWYSIDWGKGGERRTTVRKSLRDLVELTQLAKGSIVRSLDEAIEKGYIERVEPGFFDLAGNRAGAITVYGIKWTKDYTYTYEGLPVNVGEATERPQNETRVSSPNAPKMRHGQRSQNETRNAPKMRHAERPQNETIRITKTTIPNTFINNNSSSPSPHTNSVAAAEEVLLKAGFDRKTAEQLSTTNPLDVITEQVSFLARRHATKNPLGLLRQAIVENWAPPAEPRTTDVGSSISQAFAANFYAGYNGNSEAPISDPSPADAQAAERLVNRLLEVFKEPEQVPMWGRQFGTMVAREHGHKKHSLPALRLALQRHGDNFYSRLRESREAELRHARNKASLSHYEKFQQSYRGYIAGELARNESMNSKLFQTLLAEESEKLQVFKANRFGLNVEQICAQYLSGRLERFQQLVLLEEGHGVLHFWAWDKANNPERFNEASL